MKYKIIIPQEEPKLTNVCIKCGVDLYCADNFACQEHPKNCKGIHLSEETLKERALKEEPKQETTLEEAAINHSRIMFDHEICDSNLSFKAGAKWQQKRSYSEEEVMYILQQRKNNFEYDLDKWFEQFKNK